MTLISHPGPATFSPAKKTPPRTTFNILGATQDNAAEAEQQSQLGQTMEEQARQLNHGVNTQVNLIKGAGSRKKRLTVGFTPKP